MAEKFIDDIVAEQQKIAAMIVQLKKEIEDVSNSVGTKENLIQELAGKLDVLKQVHEFYTKGVIAPDETARTPEPQPEPQPEPIQQEQPQSVFGANQQDEQPQQ